jgi:hypothetical protein
MNMQEYDKQSIVYMVYGRGRKQAQAFHSGKYGTGQYLTMPSWRGGREREGSIQRPEVTGQLRFWCRPVSDIVAFDSVPPAEFKQK